jgi:DNA-binding NtrC family response regulator
MELYLCTPSGFLMHGCRLALGGRFPLTTVECRNLTYILALAKGADALLLDFEAFSRDEIEIILSRPRCSPGGGCRVFLLMDAAAMAGCARDYEGRAVCVNALALDGLAAMLTTEANRPARNEIPTFQPQAGRDPLTAYRRQAFLDRVRTAARSGADILLLGESGAGKSWLAEKIYCWAGRRGNFLSESLANISPDLFESELFGTAAGAYTGAVNRMGLLEAAGNGTLFLDEIGELPLRLQSKLFAALDRRTFRRVGSMREIPFRGRLLFATNKDLGRAAREGSFREELYNRISTVTIRVPPLRDRPQEIAELAAQFARDEGRTLSAGAVEKLGGYRYPGNVRELKHIIYRSCLLSSRNTLEADDIRFASEI